MLAGFTIESVMEGLSGSAGVGQVFVLLVMMGLSVVIIATRNCRLSLLMLFMLSLLTGADSEAVANGAYVGRWWFVALAALVAIQRPAPISRTIMYFYFPWVGINMVGMLYTPDPVGGIVRAVYFSMGVGAFLFALGPRNETPESLVKLIRWMAYVGIGMACVHIMYVAPPGRRARGP